MRMARVNVTMPDDLYTQARQQGLNISRLAQQAVTAELTRRSKIAQLDAYLAQLETEVGPISEAERAEASAWADRVLAPAHDRRSA
jgi:post-segregation antitoxin (ccd killing protein)